MNEMPESIRVGPYRFTIECSETAILRVSIASKGNRMGEMNSSNLTLTIKPDMPPDQLADTLLHEVLHAVLYTVGTTLEDEEQERIVGTISPMLLDTLRRNPMLVAYLLDQGAD